MASMRRLASSALAASVLASRCGAGVRPVHGERANNWLQSTTLDPLKARVRLIAGLGAGLRGVRLKRWFERG